MSDMTFEQVLESAKQLSLEERALLVEQLQETLQSEPDYSVTREQLDAELEQLRASGAFDNVESLYGKFANPKVDLSQDDIDSDLHQIGTAWEEEIDEFFGQD